MPGGHRYYQQSNPFLSLSRPTAAQDSARQMRVTRRTWTAAMRATIPAHLNRDLAQARSEVNRTNSRWSLDHAYVYEVLKSGKVIRIAGVQRRVMGMRGGCDQQIHRASAGLPSNFYDRSREPTVTGSNHFVDGQSIELTLKNAESPQTFGPHRGRLGNEYSKVQFGQRGSADSQNARDRRNVRGNHDARVEHAPLVRTCPLGHGSCAQGSRTTSSTSSRSSFQSASPGPANRSATPSQ